MGANQSARKVTVVNDEASGVIKISDSVVQRLKGEIGGEPQKQQEQQEQKQSQSQQQEEPKKTESVTPPPPPPPPAPAPAPAPVAEAAPAPPPPPSPGQVWQRPIIQYIEEPSISALRVKAEKEEEMKTLEDYWKDRLQKQEESFMANAKLTEEEIIKSAKHVGTLFKPNVNKEICRESQLAVQSCYEANPSKPLLCRDKVLEFTNCVAAARLEMLSSGA